MTTTSEPVRDVFEAGGRGLQHQGLRRANERAVLTLIGFNDGVSNAEIARLSGLAPQTVSAILVDIEAAGLIERGAVLRGRRGQPATPIFLNRDGAYSIGVEIGWRHVEVILINLQGQVLDKQRWHHAFPDATTIIDKVADVVGAFAMSLPEAQRDRLRGIGVAMPATIRTDLDLLDASGEQQALWAGVDLAAELGRRTGLDVSLFNDGNAACWAELIAYPRPRPGNFIYFLVSRYIAAGIVGEGQLWEGPSGNSANLGSMLVSLGGEDMQPAHFIASVAALERRLNAAGFAVDAEQLETWDWQAFGAVAEAWIADSAKALARVVFNANMVVETDRVVLDSILPEPVVRQLVERLGTELHHLAVVSYVPPQVLPGHLGALAPAIGAAELTLYRMFFSRTLADLVA